MQAQAKEAPEWMQQMQRRKTEQLIEEGFIQIDEFGELKLTDQGKQRAATRLDRLPDGDEILLHVAFCESHDIPLMINEG